MPDGMGLLAAKAVTEAETETEIAIATITEELKKDA